MSRLSVFATAVVLSALATTPVAFAKEHHHTHKAHHASIVRSGQGYADPRWSYAASRPPVENDDTPSYNDPSKFGGSTALPVTR
jgi:hypothetical protein